jgi:hypothetical protein
LKLEETRVYFDGTKKSAETIQKELESYLKDEGYKCNINVRCYTCSDNQNNISSVAGLFMYCTYVNNVKLVVRITKIEDDKNHSLGITIIGAINDFINSKKPKDDNDLNAALNRFGARKGSRMRERALGQR